MYGKLIQLFDFHKSQGNDMPPNLAPDTNLPITLIKETTKHVTPKLSHQYGTRSKTRIHSIVLDSSSEDGGSFGFRALVCHLTNRL